MNEEYEHFKTLSDKINPQEDEIIYVEDLESHYVYHDGTWHSIIISDEEMEKPMGDMEMSIYDMNRQLISQLPAYGEKEWAAAKADFETWYKEILKTNKNYFLLYGREANYFTLFKFLKGGEFKTLFNGVKTILEELGPVRDFSITKDKLGIEIWVEVQGQLTYMLLFGYDRGVVTYNG